MSHVITVGTDDFDRLVLAADRPVLVDFWAPWCMPCRSLAPVLEDIADDFADLAVIAKVNVETDPDLSRRFGVAGLPTLAVFRDGTEVSRSAGVQSRARIAAMLEALL